MTRFCTDLSAASGEPLPGTGKHQSRILLVRWPKGGWGRNLAVAPDMPPKLAAAIEGARADGWRVSLIDRKGEGRGRYRMLLYPERLTRTVATHELVGAVEALRAGDRAGWTAQDRPVLTACTHGKKDRCCAKFGFKAYKALAAEAGPDGPEVWEATHLGGCRLSGSALALPGMRKYGRLRPEDAPALLADEAAGRPWLPGWRGPSHLEPEAQAVAHAAEAWARSRGGRATGDPVADGAAWTVPVTTANGPATLTIRTQPRSHERPGTCEDLDAGEAASAVSYDAAVEEGAGSLRQLATPCHPHCRPPSRRSEP
jgi:hypothetical protein